MIKKDKGMKRSGKNKWIQMIPKKDKRIQREIIDHGKEAKGDKYELA